METPCVAAPLPDCWVVGHGLLGQALAAALRVRGGRVLTLDAVRAADVVGDAADESVLLQARALLNPQLVFCCQATGGGDAADYRHVYTEVVRRMIQVVPAARPVFCSSVSVYGAAAGRVDEETIPVTPSERAQVLLETEKMVPAVGGVVLRLAPLYGSGRCEVLRRHLAGEPTLPGSDDRILSYLYAGDAVSALMAAISAPSDCYNVSGESVRKADLYESFAAATGVASSAESSPVSRRGLSDRWVDCSRLRQLGWLPQMTLYRFAAQCYRSFLPDAT